MSGTRIALLAAASAAIYGAAIALVLVDPSEVGELFVLPVVAGAAFVLTGIVARARRPENRTGVYLLGVGYLWSLGVLTTSSNDWVFTIGYLLDNLVWVPFTALVLAYPSGQLRGRLERAIPLVTGALLTTTSLFVLLFDAEPAPDRCDPCARSAIVVADRPGVADVFDAIAIVGGLVLIAIVVRILARRWRDAGPSQRRLLTPILVSGGATLLSVALLIVTDAISSSAAEVMQIVFFAAIASVPLAFLFGILRTRLARASVTDVVVALDAGVPIQEALADALGDPTLELVFRVAGGSQWVDANGHRVPEPEASPGRAVTLVERTGLPIAALLHEDAVADDRELIEAVAAAAGLALQNERLQAELRAQFEVLRTITDTAPSLLVNISTDGRIRNQNRAAIVAAGIDDQEAIRGAYFWDVFISPEEREAVIERFRALSPTFEAGEYENTFQNAQGERRVIAWRAAPVHGPDGQVESIVAGGIDITDRYLLEEEKERERAFLNAIANEAPSLLCLIDETGRVEPNATNKAFEAALEYAPADTGDHLFWERYVDPEDADEVRRVLERCFAGEQVGEHDHRWVASSGRRLTVAWTCTPLPRVDERTLFLISGVDVTVRKQRELELQRERDATTTVIETIPSLIAVLDVEGVIVDRAVDNTLAAVNRAFHETLGWRDDQLIGRRLVDIVADDDRPAAEAAIATAAAGEVSGELESAWHRADGTPVLVAWRAAAVTDATLRRPRLVLVTGMDVTERRARELEVERRRDFLDALTDAIPSYLAAVDPDACVVEDGVNPAFADAFGWSVEEITGRSFLDVLAPEDEHAGRMAIANAANGVPQADIESRWLCRDGSTRVVSWAARPVVDYRGRNLVLVSGSDVTERKQHEEHVRASRARIVAAADDARRRLERNLHDGAQQRLVALSVSLRLAESKLGTDPEAARLIIAGAREELAHALEELRELARGIHPAVLTDRGLAAAVDALVSRSPIPVTTDVTTAELEPSVQAAVYYVIAESLTNVAKYASAGSADVRVAVDEGRVTVTVTDDGVGGADPATGSGLRGLADRLDALDGTLTVDSPPGGGTRVCAEIPIPVRSTALTT